MQIKRPSLSKARTLLAAAALTGAALVAAPTPEAHAAVFVSVGIAPPAIPLYEQPLCPGDGYIWTPGYWAWGPGGYYWVDGAWVLPPYEDALWTPGWWGMDTGLYYWHPGYWGRTVGYYGGINYGFGYFGTGFYGGYWNSGRFWYNRAYGHFGPGFHGNFYNRAYAGFNGRPGGVSFVSHTPERFAVRGGAGFHGSEGFRGDAGFRGNEGFHGNAGVRATEAAPNRGGFNGYSRSSEPAFNRGNTGAVNRRQGFTGGAEPRGNFGGNRPAFNGNPAPRNFGGGMSESRGAFGGGRPAFQGGGAPAGGGFHGAPAGGGGGFHGGGGGSHGGGHR